MPNSIQLLSKRLSANLGSLITGLLAVQAVLPLADAHQHHHLPEPLTLTPAPTISPTDSSSYLAIAFDTMRHFFSGVVQTDEAENNALMPLTVTLPSSTRKILDLQKKINKQNVQAVSPYTDFTLGVYWDPISGGLVPKNLTLLSQQSGINHFVLAFLTAEQGTNCNATWGGYSEYPVDPVPWGKADIDEFKQAGGSVAISFGGAAGTYLEQVCEDEKALTQALTTVVEAYQVTALDFDIEGSNLLDQVNIQKLATSVKQLQTTNPAITVSLTLPVLPTGLTTDGMNAVSIFLKQNVLLTQVNIMAMDYGDAAPNPDQMGKYAMQAANATVTQLHDEFFKDKTIADVWQMLSITPMIGMNDIFPERFTLSDAATLADFAKTTGAQLKPWAIDVDHPCKKNETRSDVCSGTYNNAPLQANDFDYARAFSTGQVSHNVAALSGIFQRPAMPVNKLVQKTQIMLSDEIEIEQSTDKLIKLG